MSRYRKNVEKPPAPLQEAAAAQRAMHEAIGERSRAFLAAADAGWTMAQIGKAAGLSPTMVHRIVVAEEVLRDGGYIHVKPARVRRVRRLPS